MSFISPSIVGAMSDSIDALRSGVLSLVPELDGAGRAVIYNSTTALSSLSRQEKVVSTQQAY